MSRFEKKSHVCHPPAQGGSGGESQFPKMSSARNYNLMSRSAQKCHVSNSQ